MIGESATAGYPSEEKGLETDGSGTEACNACESWAPGACWSNRQTIVGLPELKHLEPETKLNSDSGYIATVAGVSKCVTEIEGKICWTKRVTHQGMGGGLKGWSHLSADNLPKYH